MEISNYSWKGVVMTVYQTISLMLQSAMLIVVIYKK